MISDIERVLGGVPFASNLRLPGMLHCRVVRSSAPHARLVSVDADVARKMPGVHAVVTGSDLVADGRVGLCFGPVLHDQPVLAYDKVRYVGEPVAAVVARTAEAAEDAAATVAVPSEEPPAVFAVHEALADGAPRLFDA